MPDFFFSELLNYESYSNSVSPAYRFFGTPINTRRLSKILKRFVTSITRCVQLLDVYNIV